VTCVKTGQRKTYQSVDRLILLVPESKEWLGKYQGADKSLAQPGRKQARKHVRDARDFNKIETRAVIKFLFLQGKTLKEIHAITTEALACFLPDRAKNLSAPRVCVLLP
jgi:hypothetical protein